MMHQDSTYDLEFGEEDSESNEVFSLTVKRSGWSCILNCFMVSNHPCNGSVMETTVCVIVFVSCSNVLTDLWDNVDTFTIIFMPAVFLLAVIKSINL